MSQTSPAARRRWRERNPEKHAACMREGKRTYHKKHPDRVYEADRRRQLKRDYGITPLDYNDMWRSQDGRCGICGLTQERTLHVDHDHGTGKVRGLLCDRCNLGIGLFKESVTNLARAMEWIAR